MRVVIDESVFGSSEVDTVCLISLFHLALICRHSVLPEPLDAPLFAEWLEQRDQETRDECRLAVDLGLELQRAVQASFEVRVTLANQPSWGDPPQIPVKEAHSFLQRPLEIIVENARNDRDFLLAVADCHQREQLATALEEGLIRFEHGGGLEEMYLHLEEARREPWKMRRSFWVFDSDALAPGHPSPQSDRLRKRCENLNIMSHQLARRTSESYLPVPALRELWAANDSTRKKKVRALTKLRREQRHHYNMKNGFAGDRDRLAAYSHKSTTKRIVRAAEALYLDVLPELAEVLEHGLDRRLHDLFHSPELRRQEWWFYNDDPSAEMRHLIDMVLVNR